MAIKIHIIEYVQQQKLWTEVKRKLKIKYEEYLSKLLCKLEETLYINQKYKEKEITTQKIRELE